MRYIVGNGDLIQTWADPWLPLHTPRPPRRLDQNQQRVLHIQDFFLPNKTGWNEQLLREHVVPEDVPHILTLKLSQTQMTDYLGWHYTESGIYSVKSGYWLASHLPEGETTTRPPAGNPQLKQHILKTTTAPKIKHFLWRMLSRALGTGEELERRHIHQDKFCNRCITETETTDHLFFTCPHATQIWRASSIPIHDLMDPHISLETKMITLFEWHKLGTNNSLQAHLPFWILWRIWKSRNKLTFMRRNNQWEKDLQSANQDAEEWSTYGGNYRDSCKNPVLVSDNRTPHHWKRLEADWIQCNYDGSFTQQ